MENSEVQFFFTFSSFLLAILALEVNHMKQEPVEGLRQAFL
jgi:hypothetical protein